ncbi:uncharacterized protein LOC142624952 [Castanea sativa]|uniref:uncharacterized protein LOC142624952 n=1 Tax=Castanea sativa TaxID=21020 RepID=UPI003F64B16C
MWKGIKNGKFSANSAYNSIREMGNNNGEDCSDDSGMKRVWKCIRNLKLPNKIQSFAWRACCKALATKSNLKKRKITKDDICPQCGKEAKTNLHLLWFCDWAKEVWSNSKAVFPFVIESSWSFIDVVWQLVNHRPICSSLMEKLFSLYWEIWKDRNTVRNRSRHCAGKTLVRSFASMVEEYRAANERVCALNPTKLVKWHPLDPPRFKMNVDGAVFKDHRATGSGMVIRDSQGLVLAAMSKRIPTTLAALEIEAKSMEIAVHFAWEMGFREVYFETDSCSLKNILTGILVAFASIETIIESILAQMDKFRFTSFTHVKLDGNRPAHILAQFAKQVGDFVVWLEETPNLIEDACSQDVSRTFLVDL